MFVVVPAAPSTTLGLLTDAVICACAAGVVVIIPKRASDIHKASPDNRLRKVFEGHVRDEIFCLHDAKHHLDTMDLTFSQTNLTASM
ncbi:hypothetical protein J7382_18700 [Shimia sp. R11_0]|nr:hypothetical protein [Shimia sp. R11_0]